MRKHVELRADLADLGSHVFLVGVAFVRAHGPAGSLGVDVEPTCAEQRHVRRQYSAELYHFTGFDKAGCAQYGFRAHMIGRSALVVRAPFRRTPLVGPGRLPGLRECSSRHYRCDSGPRDQQFLHVLLLPLL
jgi:hypothetical protein